MTIETSIAMNVDQYFNKEGLKKHLKGPSPFRTTLFIKTERSEGPKGPHITAVFTQIYPHTGLHPFISGK